MCTKYGKFLENKPTQTRRLKVKHYKVQNKQLRSKDKIVKSK